MIPNVFTMEASFCGAEKLGCHFTCEQYMEVGRELCRSFIYYFDLVPKNLALGELGSPEANGKANNASSKMGKVVPPVDKKT